MSFFGNHLEGIIVTIQESVNDYLSLGWPILPIQYQSKHPLIRWKKFQLQVPTNSDWESWLQEFNRFNIALLLGRISSLASLDCDGEEALSFVLSRIAWPYTPCVLTPRGRRWIFQLPPNGMKTASWKGSNWSCSLLGEGSLAILPPSIHPQGITYQWDKGFSPWEVPIQTIPDSLLTLPSRSSARYCKTVQYKKRPFPGAHHVTIIPNGQRNQTLFREACRMIAFGFPPPIVRQALSELNQRCLPPLDDSELDTIAHSSSRYY